MNQLHFRRSSYYPHFHRTKVFNPDITALLSQFSKEGIASTGKNHVFRHYYILCLPFIEFVHTYILFESVFS